jgi:hypothetical protein
MVTVSSIAPWRLSAMTFIETVSNIIIISVEANCVIIAACIPMLMPLLGLWFGTSVLSGGELQLQSLPYTGCDS